MKKIFVLCFLTFSNLFSQNLKPLEEVTMNDLTSDLMIMNQEGNRITQSLWLPPVYWKVSLQNSEFAETSMSDMIMDLLKGYSIFAVLDSDVDKFNDINKNIVVQIKDTNNKIKLPLNEEDLPRDVSMMISQLKPSIAQMLGQYGEKLTFFVFDAEGLNPREKGTFTITINNIDLNYKLPLSGLVKNKTCPEGNEELNGSWDYCPWHGKELKE